MSVAVLMGVIVMFVATMLLSALIVVLIVEALVPAYSAFTYKRAAKSDRLFCDLPGEGNS